MTITHTPGPWHFNRHTGGKYFADVRADLGIDGGVGKITTIGVILKYVPKEEQEANAYLIAAAPDMLTALNDALEALKLIRINHDRDHELSKALTSIRAAIAKAEGRGSPVANSPNNEKVIIP